ncbi:GDP-mannose mannosyl hydrolase [Neptuniibacter pectenicola]|jgi:colanic acid biosynthesis protein WcaH|uniref:GDP-mannose mannosyl hydrolase n=1 Tax=Neptuniibacter pectenicola TaxID=1806669 RepID=UPI0030ED98FC|tara:strand:+ start:655 stop:1131 length:477 start_codon:yes stop_codon:yes gene_type:complete
MQLEDQGFLQLIRLAPLFSIDLVVVNNRRELFVGKRVNSPAKDWWFVPGGRVYKDETLKNAFSRITLSELGMEYDISKCQPLGLYEHFYNVSMLCKGTSTHYINMQYLIQVNESETRAPNIQHHAYRWLSLDEVGQDPLMHKNSKLFTPSLFSALNNG